LHREVASRGDATERSVGSITPGNTEIDALFDALAIIDADPLLTVEIERMLPQLDPAKRVILATGHRCQKF
jgi:hypothetical protein